MLKKYWDDGVLDLVEVADSLGHAAFESDRLAFLGHYAQFHELYKVFFFCLFVCVYCLLIFGVFFLPSLVRPSGSARRDGSWSIS